MNCWFPFTRYRLCTFCSTHMHIFNNPINQISRRNYSVVKRWPTICKFVKIGGTRCKIKQKKSRYLLDYFYCGQFNYNWMDPKTHCNRWTYLKITSEHPNNRNQRFYLIRKLAYFYLSRSFQFLIQCFHLSIYLNI